MGVAGIPWHGHLGRVFMGWKPMPRLGAWLRP